MYQSNIIAIAGYKNSGKDTSAEMLRYLLNSPKIFHKYCWFKLLKKLYTKPYKIVSFAQPLKNTLAILLNINVAKFNDRDFKEHVYIKLPELVITKSPKKTISEKRFEKCISNNDFSFIQTTYLSVRQLLQVFGTEIMRNFLGDTLWINSTLKTSPPIIISDLRFKIEYEEIKNKNGLCIFINNPNTKPGHHASEKEVSELVSNNKFDYIIDNKGSLEDLFNALKMLL